MVHTRMTRHTDNVTCSTPYFLAQDDLIVLNKIVHRHNTYRVHTVLYDSWLRIYSNGKVSDKASRKFNKLLFTSNVVSSVSTGRDTFVCNNL